MFACWAGSASKVAMPGMEQREQPRLGTTTSIATGEGSMGCLPAFGIPPGIVTSSAFLDGIFREHKGQQQLQPLLVRH